MKIILSVTSIAILLTLFALNASSVNWESPESQTVDQMLNDNGLPQVNAPNSPPENPQQSSVTPLERPTTPNIPPGNLQQTELPTNNTLSAPLNITRENETQWFKVAVTRFNQGRYEESLQAYDKVIQIDQQNAVVWNNRGIVLGVLGKSDAALQSFVKATSINPSFSEAWFNLGIAYDIFDEYDNAINAYKKAIEINPSYEQARMNMNEDINFISKNPLDPYP